MKSFLLSIDLLQVRDISAVELHSLLQNPKRKVVVIDARSEEERAVSHIASAVSKEEFEAHREELKDYLVVAYWYACQSNRFYRISSQKLLKACCRTLSRGHNADLAMLTRTAQWASGAASMWTRCRSKVLTVGI